MKSPVRIIGLTTFIGVLALLSLVYILFADYFVASSVRTVGTQLVGAKVELGEANLSLGEEKLGLSKLSVTNPKKPMTNAIELDYLELDLDTSALTWNKFIVDKVQIKNLLMNTPRESSGAIDDHWLDVSEWEPMSEIQDLGSMTAENLPEPAEILAREKLETLDAIENFKTSLATTEAELTKQLAALPDEAKIASYKKRFEELKSSDSGANKLLGLLGKGKEFKALRKDLRADIKALKAFKETLQSQRKVLTTQLSDLKNMPEKDFNRLKQKYSLSGDGVANLVSTVFGPQIGGWMKEAMGYYQLLQPYLSQMESTGNAEAQASQVLTDRGRKVVFEDTNPLPDYLIKTVDISTPEQSGQLSISGIVNNLTTQPERWSEPLDLELTGTASFLKNFSVSGIFDHRQSDASTDTVKVGISALDLTQILSGTEQQSPVTTKAGNVDINADINIVNDVLNSSVRLNFKQLALEVADSKPWVSSIVDGISALPEFEVVIQLSGDVTAPTTSISSPDLSKLSQQVMQSMLSDQLQGFESDLLKQIQQATSDPLSNLPGLDGIDGLLNELNLKEMDINKLLNNLG